MSPRAGKLRNWVTIEQETESQSTSGEPGQTPWTTFAQRWMGFETLSGREFLEAGATREGIDSRFWARDDVPGVTPKMRLYLGGRIFNITAIIPPEKPGGWLQFMTAEVR